LGTLPIAYHYDASLAIPNSSDLIGGIRKGSRAEAATTWDEWWDEARPLWRDWWRLAGDGPFPADRGEWWSAVREHASRP
jgi:hypothetical protein